MAIDGNRGVRIANYETLDVKNKSGRTMVRLSLHPIIGNRGHYVVDIEYDNKVAVGSSGRFDGGKN